MSVRWARMTVLASFFLFACQPGTLGTRQMRLIELVVPFLHGAWLRTQINRPVEGASMRQGGVGLLTVREQEILKWIYVGKSNIEIGTILGIIQAFRQLAEAKSVGPEIVMASIAEALAATAVGLLVAIPAVIAYNIYGRIIKTKMANSDATARILMTYFARTKPEA